MKDPTFQEFLETWWMEREAEGQSKDQSIEAIERWIEDLEVETLISLADIYGKEMHLRGYKSAADVALAALKGETV